MATPKSFRRKRPVPTTLKGLHLMTAINPNTVLLTRNDEPLRLPAPEGETGEELTIALAIQMAIDSPMKGDEEMTSENKLKLYRISRKLASDEEVEISNKDATLALERANKFWGAMVYGRLVEQLDPGQLEN